MISIFIFRIKSAAWQEIAGLGDLTRFRRKGTFCGFDRPAPAPNCVIVSPSLGPVIPNSPPLSSRAESRDPEAARSATNRSGSVAACRRREGGSPGSHAICNRIRYMTDVANILRGLSTAPSDRDAYDSWLEMKDIIAFLKDNVSHDEFIVYATFQNTFIHALLAPTTALDPPDYEDLLDWQCDPYSSWGVEISFGNPRSISVTPPLSHTGSKTLDKAEQLIFASSFEGRTGEKHYYEVLQKFAQVSAIHFLYERQAYCRLDELGDIEEVIRIIELPKKAGELYGGTTITCKRSVIDEYAVLTDCVIVRTFDFTFCELSRFGGCAESRKVEQTIENDFFYRAHVEKGHAAFRRGCQLVWPSTTKESIIERFGPGSRKGRQYTTFIAHDWKHGVVKEASCNPEHLGNYFVESDLPFETSPVFFKPEVLLKYKADSEKYHISDRSISCRGTWHLQTYDINEAGQVHTYLVYLKNLPYQEQLYWKSFNEPPKGTISKRSIKTDFEGCWDTDYDPLNSLKAALREFSKQQVPWWELRSEKLLAQLHYPATTSGDEWANDLLLLDQLVVEGLQVGWLKEKALELGRTLDPKFASIKVTEECLLGLGFAQDEAEKTVTPLKTAHHLRTKVKGHSSGGEALRIKFETLKTYGTYRNHFQTLCKDCDQSMRRIGEALKELA